MAKETFERKKNQKRFSKQKILHRTSNWILDQCSQNLRYIIHLRTNKYLCCSLSLSLLLSHCCSLSSLQSLSISEDLGRAYSGLFVPLPQNFYNGGTVSILISSISKVLVWTLAQLTSSNCKLSSFEFSKLITCSSNVTPIGFCHLII